MKTQLLETSTPELLASAVETAASQLAAGEPVALPTETVYGLAADALRPDAVLKIFEAKERPFFDPLIVHVPDREWLERIVQIPYESMAVVEALIAKFWPGPLTLVLPRREIVPDLVTAGLDTVAVRMSGHPVFRAAIEKFGQPLAAPSANRFGRISPTAAAHVMSELKGRIPLVLDGGSTEHGLESTIVKVQGSGLEILRAGPVTPTQLEAVWREALGDTGSSSYALPSKIGGPWELPGFSKNPEAPGQLVSHYAPRTPLVLGRSLDVVAAHRLQALEHRLGEYRLGLLSFVGREAKLDEFQHVEVLSPNGDLREAAATLFAKMRRLDEVGLDLILAEPVPEHGLGIAIMDRLRKAAAEHA